MKAHRWVLLILILLAFARGAWALGTKSLWWDESLSLYRARQDLAGVLSNQTVLTDNTQELVTVDNHPPLYFLVLWGAMRLAGKTEFALRFPSLVCAVLVVPLLYVTGKRVGGRRTALAAAALGAVSPMYLWYSQEARAYTMLAFLGLLSFYLFLRAFWSDDGEGPERWRPWPIAAYIVTSIALVFTHYLGALLVGYELLVLAIVFTRRRAAMLTIAILLAAISLPLVYVWLNRPEATAKVGFHFIPLLSLLRDLLNSFSLGLSVDVQHWYVLAIDLAFLALLAVGVVWLVGGRSPHAASRRRSGWLVVGYLLVPVALTYLLSYVRPVYMNSRHLILVTPAFYLLTGAGIAAISYWSPAGSRRVVPSLLALAACLVLLSGIGYSTYNYFADPAYDKDQHRDWGAYLREHVRPGDVVIVDPPCIAELYDYYAGSDEPWVGLPLLSGPRQQTVDKLMELVGSYDRVWLAFSHTPPWCDPRRYPEKWLNQNAFRVDYQKFASNSSIVLVAAYAPRRPTVLSLPPGSYPVDARYSSALRLDGYRPISTAQGGQPLHVELFWAVDGGISDEASVVLRLVDAEGHVWGQGEQCPFNGLYPMWQWEPGVTLQDGHQLTIQAGTPPGTYELEAMLIRRPSDEGCLGERGSALTPISGSAVRGDRVLLGEVEVGRPERPATVAELAIESPRRVQMGGGLELLGEHVAVAELRPGDPLDVTLYWATQQTSLPDAQFRLKLLDEAGISRQEVVIRPAGNSYPANAWQAGDRFKGQFRLWLPEGAPPGDYSVWLAPEPPVEDGGATAAVRRWLSCIAGSCAAPAGLHLSQVRVSGDGQAGTTALPARPNDLDVPHALEATLGGQVRLLGYDLSAETIQAGDAISLTLYWQALRPMELSYHVFNHLAAPSGEALAQKDGVPRDGAYPTNLWQPGELVIDCYRIPVDPGTLPGVYPLQVGMYRLETLKRLPLVDATGRRLAGDQLALAEIRVLAAPTPTPLPPVNRSYLPVVMKP